VRARCEAARAAASVGVHLRHSDECLRCQAAEARQRRLQRQFDELRPDGPPAPMALVGRILAGVEGPGARQGARHPADTGTRRRVAYITAGAGGAAVVAAALVGSRSRARRVRVAG